MASVNRVILVGNLTRDPQLKYLPSQTPVAEFGLAMNRRFKTATGEDREEVCFVDCAAFGRPAEVINQYCQKGKLIYVEGRLKFDTWEDKQGGGKRSKLSVVVENFQFLGSREGGGSPPGGGYDAPPADAAEAPPAARKAPRPAATAPPAAQPPLDEKQQFTDNDIPF
jgi:single-strand DNA-binding protein